MAITVVVNAAGVSAGKVLASAGSASRILASKGEAKRPSGPAGTSSDFKVLQSRLHPGQRALAFR